MACDISFGSNSVPDGTLVVAGYFDNMGTGIGGVRPQPGDRCLPYIAASSANDQPFRVGGTAASAVQLAGPNGKTLIYTASQGGKPVHVVGCKVDETSGKFLTTLAAAGPTDTPVAIGQPCLDEIGMLIAKSGLDLTGPVAAGLGGAAQDGSGLLWWLNRVDDVKSIQCDHTAGGFTVTAYEDENGLDTTKAGGNCLDVVSEEISNGYLAMKPTAVPQLEECLIFDYTGPGLRARALPTPEPPPPPLSTN